MATCNPKSTLSDPDVHLSKGTKTQETDTPPEPLLNRYREIIGGVMYLAASTRPDMAQALNFLSRFCQDPQAEHMTAAKRQLAYLKKTATHGLHFNANQPGYLLGYSDADWAADLDGRKSTTGYIFTMCGGTVAWSSRLQRDLAQSTYEAEFVCLNEATREAVRQVRMRPDKNVPSGGGTHPSEGANASGSDVTSVALSTSLRSFLSRQAVGSVDYAHPSRQEGTYPRSRG